jgi:DNA-binding NarL/FixJ family response regulator
MAESTPQTAADEAEHGAEAESVAPDASGTPLAEEPVEAPKPERPALVVIDADASERARVESAAPDLECPVRALAPDAVMPPRLGRVTEGALALVVAWDLGGRPGLDVVETLARLPAAKGLRIAMAADAATRAMVSAALRAGATHFLSRPYDVDELRHLLEGIE